MKKIALLLLFLVLAVGCAFNQETEMELEPLPTSSATLAEQMQQSGLSIGSIPPALTLETLEGEQFDQTVLSEKHVILNFWATWCEPCRLEMPDIAQLANEYPDDLAVVAINLKEDEAAITSFLEELGLHDFHVLLDREGKLADQFQVIALPTTYFLNKDGTIAHKHIGFMNYEQFKQTYLQMNER